MEEQPNYPKETIEYLSFHTIEKKDGTQECIWPAFVQTDAGVVPTLHPRTDYKQLIAGYNGYNPAEIFWEEIVANTSLSQRYQKEGKLDRKAIEILLDTKAEEFVTKLELHQSQHPFFSFAREHVKEAFLLAYVIHYDQKRKSGDDYIVHVKSVVYKLLEMLEHSRLSEGIDLTEMIMGALLHDVKEDATIRYMADSWLFFRKVEESQEQDVINKFRLTVEQYLLQCFKQRVAYLVDSLTTFSKKIPPSSTISTVQSGVKTNIAFVSDPSQHFSLHEESVLRDEVKKLVDTIKLIQKLLSRIPPDFAVILLKIADRLHNLGTARYLEVYKRRSMARESLDFYVPIAILLGLNDVAKQMEDMSYPYAFETEEEYKGYARDFEKAKRKLLPIYDQEIQRLQSELPFGVTVERRQVNVGRLISAYESWKKKGDRPDISFFNFILQYSSPYKIVLITSGNMKGADDRTSCQNLYDVLFGSFIIAQGDLIHATSTLGDRYSTAGHGVPISAEKIEICYGVRAGMDMVPITLKIVSPRIDQINRYGEIGPYVNPIVNETVVGRFLQMLTGEIDGKSDITYQDLERIREKLRIFKEACFGTIALPHPEIKQPPPV